MSTAQSGSGTSRRNVAAGPSGRPLPGAGAAARQPVHVRAAGAWSGRGEHV